MEFNMKKLTVSTRKVRISFFYLLSNLLLVLAFSVLCSCSNADLLDGDLSDNAQISAVSEPNMDELFLSELHKLESRGNFGNPDFDSEGQMFYVQYDDTSKSYISQNVTFSEAVEAVQICRWVDVNGSGTSLSAAIESTKLRAQTLNRNMLLVYIAQGLDYWAADDERFKQQYDKLISEVTKSGTKIYATSHSWSGHIVARLLRDNPLVTHFAINPAHGNLKEGEKIDDYVYDLKITKSPTYILAGTSDLVARYGGGIAWKGLIGIVGYNSVYYGINDNDKVSLIKVKNSGHLIEDMIKHGGFDEIKTIIR